jgi:hypothetical protein
MELRELKQDPELSEELSQLQGAEILNIGFDEDCLEGGLGIDYVKDGCEYRLVLGYNNLGTWIHKNLPIAIFHEDAILREKVENFIESLEGDWDGVLCEENAMNRTITIVKSDKRLDLSLREIKFLPEDAVRHIRNIPKYPDAFICALHMSDWLYP